MPPACEPRRSYRSSSPISIVTGWSSGSNRARACPREGGGQEGSVCHSLAQPARDIARMTGFGPRDMYVTRHQLAEAKAIAKREFGELVRWEVRRFSDGCRLDP